MLKKIDTFLENNFYFTIRNVAQKNVKSMSLLRDGMHFKRKIKREEIT